MQQSITINRRAPKEVPQEKDREEQRFAFTLNQDIEDTDFNVDVEGLEGEWGCEVMLQLHNNATDRTFMITVQADDWKEVC